jgi:hypothetical protein
LSLILILSITKILNCFPEEEEPAGRSDAAYGHREERDHGHPSDSRGVRLLGYQRPQTSHTRNEVNCYSLVLSLNLLYENVSLSDSYYNVMVL